MPSAGTEVAVAVLEGFWVIELPVPQVKIGRKSCFAADVDFLIAMLFLICTFLHCSIARECYAPYNWMAPWSLSSVRFNYKPGYKPCDLF